MEHKKRLKLALDESDYDYKSLAAALKTHPNSIKLLLSGKRGYMSVPNHFKACRLLGVDANWLATGEGEMRSASVWPFVDLTPAQWGTIPDTAKRQHEAGLRAALPGPKLVSTANINNSPIAGAGDGDQEAQAARNKRRSKRERDKNK